MRVVIWLALPVGVVLAAAGITIVLQMANGGGYCGTWLQALAPFCG